MSIYFGGRVARISEYTQAEKFAMRFAAEGWKKSRLEPISKAFEFSIDRMHKPLIFSSLRQNLRKTRPFLVDHLEPIYN
jgi:hypothetical protein